MRCLPSTTHAKSLGGSRHGQAFAAFALQHPARFMLIRILKMVVDEWLARRADALPLAYCVLNEHH